MKKLLTATTLAAIVGASALAGTATATTLKVTYPAQQAFACLSIKGPDHTDSKCANGQPGLQETKSITLSANTLGSDRVDFFATNEAQDAILAISNSGTGPSFTINNNSNGQMSFSYNGKIYTSTNEPVPFTDGSTIYVQSNSSK